MCISFNWRLTKKMFALIWQLVLKSITCASSGILVMVKCRKFYFIFNSMIYKNIDLCEHLVDCQSLHGRLYWNGTCLNVWIFTFLSCNQTRLPAPLIVSKRPSFDPNDLSSRLIKQPYWWPDLKLCD